MVYVNHAESKVIIKLVYYGPSQGGKTANLEYLHQRGGKSSPGGLLTLSTETHQTLFFDLLPMDLGRLGSYEMMLQLYTVPGRNTLAASRKKVLDGVDGVIFVADSRPNRLEINKKSLENLRLDLEEKGRSLDDTPLVFQFNKRDHSGALALERLNHELNAKDLPFVAAIATEGTGVVQTLREAMKQTIRYLREHY